MESHLTNCTPDEPCSQCSEKEKCICKVAAKPSYHASDDPHCICIRWNCPEHGPKHNFVLLHTEKVSHCKSCSISSSMPTTPKSNCCNSDLNNRNNCVSCGLPSKSQEKLSFSGQPENDFVISSNRSEYWDRLVEILNVHFPKGKCEERGAAMVLITEVEMLLVNCKPIDKQPKDDCKHTNIENNMCPDTCKDCGIILLDGTNEDANIAEKIQEAQKQGERDGWKQGQMHGEAIGREEGKNQNWIFKKEREKILEEGIKMAAGPITDRATFEERQRIKEIVKEIIKDIEKQDCLTMDKSYKDGYYIGLGRALFRVKELLSEIDTPTA